MRAIGVSTFARKIRRAVSDILAAPRYRERAGALGEQIVRDATGSPAIELLERVAGTAAARAAGNVRRR